METFHPNPEILILKIQFFWCIVMVMVRLGHVNEFIFQMLLMCPGYYLVS